MKLNFIFILEENMKKAEYKTQQRTRILSCLRENKEKSLTVDELVDLLEKSGSSVGRTTVYRYLDSLTEQGEVRRFSRDGKKSAAFQFVENSSECSKHIHLRCSECGKFVHLGCDFMKEANEHLLKEHGFCVDNELTVLVGVCKDCMAKKGDN